MIMNCYSLYRYLSRIHGKVSAYALYGFLISIVKAFLLDFCKDK